MLKPGPGVPPTIRPPSPPAAPPRLHLLLLVDDKNPDAGPANKAGATLLERVAWERKTAELNRILLSAKPSIGIRLLDDLGLLGQVLPEMLPMHDMVQGAEGSSHYGNPPPQPTRVPRLNEAGAMRAVFNIRDPSEFTSKTTHTRRSGKTFATLRQIPYCCRYRSHCSFCRFGIIDRRILLALP